MSVFDLSREPKPLRPDCAGCAATYRGCDTNRWLRGRPCCIACDHTKPASPDATRSPSGEAYQPREAS